MDCPTACAPSAEHHFSRSSIVLAFCSITCLGKAFTEPVHLFTHEFHTAMGYMCRDQTRWRDQQLLQTNSLNKGDLVRVYKCLETTWVIDPITILTAPAQTSSCVPLPLPRDCQMYARTTRDRKHAPKPARSS